jgi:hypothetical protein
VPFVAEGGVLGQNGDAALLLQRIRVLGPNGTVCCSYHLTSCGVGVGY